MKIEKVTVSDAKELLDIYSYYVKETAISFEYDVPSLGEFEERIRSITARYPYLKAVEGNTIIGYAYANTFKGRAAYDWSVETTIYIKNDCKRNGAGKALYDALEKSLRSMGIQNMNACIASTEEESKYLTNGSIYFHEKMGFELVGKFHNSGCKFDRWFDMIWMEKIIGNHKIYPEKVSFGEWRI